MTSNTELEACEELHERSMTIIEDALGPDRIDRELWRAQAIARDIIALREEWAALRAALVAVDNPLLELLSWAEGGEMPPQSAWAAAETAYQFLQDTLKAVTR